MKDDSLLKIFTDGGARGNPGPAGCAFVIYKKGKIIAKRSQYLGNTTNNVAEYNGVLLAFKWLKKFPKIHVISELNFFLDSQLVARQLSGIYKVKNENLKKLIIKVKSYEIILGKETVYFSIPRGKNKLADSLLNKVIDENEQNFTSKNSGTPNHTK